MGSVHRNAEGESKRESEAMAFLGPRCPCLAFFCFRFSSLASLISGRLCLSLAGKYLGALPLPPEPDRVSIGTCMLKTANQSAPG